MFLMSERVRPCRARLSRSSSGRVALTALPSESTFMFGCQANSSLPLGPSTLILPASTWTLTPDGIATGCLPILDIVQVPCTSRQGEGETRRQGEKPNAFFSLSPPLLVSLSITRHNTTIHHRGAPLAPC